MPSGIWVPDVLSGADLAAAVVHSAMGGKVALWRDGKNGLMRIADGDAVLGLD